MVSVRSPDGSAERTRELRETHRRRRRLGAQTTTFTGVPDTNASMLSMS